MSSSSATTFRRFGDDSARAVLMHRGHAHEKMITYRRLWDFAHLREARGQEGICERSLSVVI